MLRDYQQTAHDLAIGWIKKSVESCVIEAATGAGKSHIIAAISETFHEISGKYVLCTAPNVDLVKQNREKYNATGNPSSIFSASIGKCLKHPVVFGTPMSIYNQIDNFHNNFGLIIIDECHGITPTIQQIIAKLKERNKMLRVLGTSATLYRLGSGYIYQFNENNKSNQEDECFEPYFFKKIYSITAPELIEKGYLTPLKIGEINAGHYDTANMQLNKMHKFAQADIDRAYTGQGRKTAAIMADIVAQSRDRHGVMIFAATVQHAKECLDSLPPELSRMIGGNINMGKHERENLVNDFKSMKFKYLVSVGTMTTGVDFTHVDVIALLRPTESIGLMQQIIGRGLRLHHGKLDCLVLDYAENITRHCPDNDIFDPKINAFGKKTRGELIKVECPLCLTENEFTGRENPEGFRYSKDGYFLDLDDNKIMSEFNNPLPSHYGRRCTGFDLVKGKIERCDYRWLGKECPTCKADNDITARYCAECKAEIINPNDKLIADFRALKRDPTQLQCDAVLTWTPIKTLSAKGNKIIRTRWITEHRVFDTYHQVQSQSAFLQRQYNNLMQKTNGLEQKPDSITYKKNSKTGFYEIYDYNRPIDKLELR